MLTKVKQKVGCVCSTNVEKKNKNNKKCVYYITCGQQCTGGNMFVKFCNTKLNIKSVQSINISNSP